VAIVSKPLGATLIHHTGTLIRFHHSDVSFLPPRERACDIELPDGRVVRGKFGRNRQLLHINGAGLVRWTKSWLGWTKSVEVVVHPVGTGDKVRLELIGGSSALSKPERRDLLSGAPKTAGLSGDRKKQEFRRWERDPKLRGLVLQTWGSKCQVGGCRAQASVSNGGVSDKLVDVHHLQSVSLAGDDSPANLVVLCLMHHGLVHRSASVATSLSIGEVHIVADGVNMRIKRDIEALLKAMSWHP